MAIIHIRLFGTVCSDSVVITDENYEDISLSFVMKVKNDLDNIQYRVVISERDLISKWKETFASGAYVVARGIIRDSIPSVVVADLLGELGLDGIADGQVQRDDGVAALHRGEFLSVITSGIVWDAIPCVAVAHLLRELGLYSIADGQMQGDNGVAAL